MGEFITLSIQAHIVSVVLLIGLLVTNLYFLSQKRTFFGLSKRLELVAPQYFLVLFTIFFTGIIVMAVEQFHFGANVWEMIVLWFVLVAIGMKGHKRYKRLDKSKEAHVEQENFKRFAFKKELVNLMLIVLLLALIYGIH